jgi:hypothetical protein
LQEGTRSQTLQGRWFCAPHTAASAGGRPSIVVNAAVAAAKNTMRDEDLEMRMSYPLPQP